MNSVDIIIKAIDEKLGKEIKVLDFQGVSSLMDYFVICHADSARQIQAIVDAIEVSLKQAGYELKSIQGNADSGWVLVDAYDVIVHVFSKEQREFYQLEYLWADLPSYGSESNV